MSRWLMLVLKFHSKVVKRYKNCLSYKDGWNQVRLRGTALGSPFSLLSILSSWDVWGAKSVPACSLPFLCSAAPEVGPGTPNPQMVEPKRRDLSKPVQTPRFKLKSTWHRDHSAYFTTVTIEGKNILFRTFFLLPYFYLHMESIH